MDYSLKQRWRLVLGRYAHTLDTTLTDSQHAQDSVLNELYQQGLAQRGFQLSGGLDQSSVHLVKWLDEAEKLFPKSVNDTLQQDAIQRFELHQLLEQPRVLETMTPSMGLLKQLMTLNAQHNPKIRKPVETIIREVAAELLTQLRPVFHHTLGGRLNRSGHRPVKRLANLDWQKTIRKNLRHFDGEKLCYEHIYFHSRQQRQLPWHVILCLDQSGSMSASVIYSAVIAGILTRIPTVRLSLIVFDTQVVDLSDRADDPVSILLATQLGGGTLIAQAWRYCEQLMTSPSRTVVATVSDFCEGGPDAAMFQQAEALINSGAKMMGMTALSPDSIPFYDTYATAQLKHLGMNIASLTPDKFSRWLALTMGLQQ